MFKSLLFFFLLMIQISAEARLKWAVDTYAIGRHSEVIDSSINLNNAILKLPQNDVQLLIRPDLRYDLSKIRFVLRPEFSSTYRQSTTSDKTTSENKTKSEADLKDVFVTAELNRYFNLSLGLQSFQWGPAELLSPSNPLFHFDSGQRSWAFKEKGKVLARLNITLDKENSIVLVAEPISNQRPEWIYGDEFTAKGLVKYEKSWNGKPHYLGLVAGLEEQETLFVGGYFNYGVTEQFSFYADSKVSQYRVNWHPVQDGLFINFERELDVQSQWHPFIISGIRWESNFDWRLEYIYNSAGYDHDKMELARQSAGQILNQNYALNLQAFLRPGLELMGRSYLYTSLRVSDFWTLKDINFYARFIKSLQDDSGSAQIETDKAVTDSLTGFLGVTASTGSAESEFKWFNDWSVATGLKWSL